MWEIFCRKLDRDRSIVYSQKEKKQAHSNDAFFYENEMVTKKRRHAAGLRCARLFQCLLHVKQRAIQAVRARGDANFLFAHDKVVERKLLFQLVVSKRQVLRSKSSRLETAEREVWPWCGIRFSGMFGSILLRLMYSTEGQNPRDRTSL